MQDFKHHLYYFKLYLTWVDSALFQSPLLVSCAMVWLMAQVVKDESNDTLAGVDDAHKVVLFTRRHFFCKRFVLLRLKKTFSKTLLKKKLKYNYNPPHEK